MVPPAVLTKEQNVDCTVLLQAALNSTTSDSAVGNVKDSFYINVLRLSNNFTNK